MIYPLLTAALILFGFNQPAFSDNLSDLPAQWRQSLNATGEIDISTLLADEQQAIRSLRADIDQLLLKTSDHDKPATDTQGRLAKMYGNLGSLYLTHGLYTSADACFSNAILLQPDNFRWAYYLAYNAHKSGNLPVALERLQAALKLDDHYPPATSRLAQTYLDLNQPDKALVEFNKLLDQKDFRAAGHNGIGQVYLLEHEYAAAAEHFTKALELEPEATQIHYPLAQALRALGQKDQARLHLQKFADQRLRIPDPLVEKLDELKNPAHQHFVNAMTSVVRKQFSKARLEFEAGLQIEPDNTAARTSYARALYLDGEVKLARKELEHVVRLDPQKHLALFLLALLEETAGNSSSAADLYQRVLKLRPEHDGANFFLGNIQLRNRNYQQAIDHYEQAIANDANNLPAHLYRLVAMMGIGSPDTQLRDAVETIIERAPSSYPPQRIRILLYALSRNSEVRNPSLASRLAERLYNTSRNPLNMELLAIAKASSGDFDTAIPLLAQASKAEQQRKHSINSRRMLDNLALLQNRQLPQLSWDDETRYLIPPLTDPLASFRDYPDANPV